MKEEKNDNLVKIDDKLFGYYITPVNNKVHAEIYYIDPLTNLKIHVLSKDFGYSWTSPIESDYIKAKNWCKSQISYIHDANI
jgi:hypothetical protein